jgi:hypothetical protein
MPLSGFLPCAASRNAQQTEFFMAAGHTILRSQLSDDLWRIVCVAAIRADFVLQVRNSYYYLDADHLGNQELYDRLNIADPDAPQPGAPGASATAAPDAAATQPWAPEPGSPDEQRKEAEANAPRADEEVPEGAEAPTAPPEPAADEAARKQADQAAEMVQPELKPKR